MTEPSGSGGSGNGAGGGGPGLGPTGPSAQQITEGVGAASTAATGAAALENDPVAGATQLAGGAAGVAGAAGVEGAQQAGQVIEAASTAVSAAQDLQHDPVGGLLGLVQAAAATAGVAGAAQDVTQAVSAAAGMAQQASGMISSLTGSSSGSTPGASARASSPPAARASRPPPAPASADSPQAQWNLTTGDRLHVRYSFSSDADGAAGWHVRRVVLEERIDRPYEAILDLSNDDTSADPLALLGQPAVLSIERHTTRDVQGVIRRVERGGSGGGDRSVTARVYLVPALWTLSQSRNTRVFQEKKVTEILQEVLEAGLGPFQREVQLDLQGTYQPREYCKIGRASCRERVS
jgi:hypothetical protein